MTDASDGGRGPMSLDDARALLREVTTFAKGDTEIVEGVGAVTSADRVWDALLSLEDAAEFVEVAVRLTWAFHPRGFDNTDLHRRYGDGIVPWLATRLDANGVLHNHPWCVVPCLMACASEEAFALAWRVKSIDGRTPWGGCGDRDLSTAWCQRHPEAARRGLEQLASTDARARAHLCVLGRVAAVPPAAGDVLALLDACALGMWPTRVRLAPPVGNHQLRVIAARGGADWGIAIEWIDGTRPSGLFAARVSAVAYGSRVRGVIDGAAIVSRPLADFGADTLDARLGAPRLALPGLGLAPDATVVAVVPYAATVELPSESPMFQTLAAALTAFR